MADYTAFWGHDDLSDVMVVLYEEAEDGSRKRKRDSPLPAHKVVLAANSQVLKAQVPIAVSKHCSCLLMSKTGHDAWSKVVNWAKAAGTDGTEQPHIDFAVPAGQLEVGESVLKAMYQHQPDLSGFGQVALLQLLMLADR
eukprot:GHUV01030162.1.p1 GENE.GHUV01030162.1~~GHUV01030162.1.p1  ORF type:complete len:140 (+),score=39.08 GHUV01030162.1:217-636(+)